MNIEEMKNITVLGAGTMGHGVALICAQKGFQVIVQDTKEEYVQGGLTRIEKFLQGSIERAKITKEEGEAIIARIKTTISLEEAVGEADLIVEAVPENMELKKGLFKEVSGLCQNEAILASNTSTISITEIASVADRPEKVIGMHFFNPVPLMKAVEVVRGVLTSDDTVKLVTGLTLKLDKTPVVVKDSPGFASTRLGVSLFMEASKMLAEGVASVKDIDVGAKLFYGHRMGPFETCDVVGLDARLNNINSLYQATGDPKWAPPLLLKQLVAAGYLGNKPGSKGGYYAYFGLESD